MTSDQTRDHALVVDAIVFTANKWADPEYELRRTSEQVTLSAPNRFTEQALAFAINQQMSLLSRDALRAWIPAFHAHSRTIGVLNPGNIPFVGLQDFLAVTLCGHGYRGTVSRKSPALLRAFASDVIQNARNIGAHMDIQFASVDAFQGSVDALIASGRDETVTAVANKFSGSTQKSPRILLRGQKYSIAILTGNETEDEREGLAEDMFLHEGMGCRNVSLVWAPAGTEVDPYLESIAHFRAVFPVHPITSQSLTMSRAFLKATDQPHAFGENLEFLLSKGDPDVQMPGHVRWTEYSKFSDVEQWLGAHSGEIQLVVTSGRRKLEVPETVSVTSPGHSQRPLLDWKSGGADITKFLHDL